MINLNETAIFICLIILIIIEAIRQYFWGQHIYDHSSQLHSMMNANDESTMTEYTAHIWLILLFRSNLLLKDIILLKQIIVVKCIYISNFNILQRILMFKALLFFNLMYIHSIL